MSAARDELVCEVECHLGAATRRGIGRGVRESLADEDVRVTSDLTLIECDRVLQRAAALGELSEAGAANRRASLATRGAQWTLLRIGAEVVERARLPSPGEPIRS